LAATTTVLWAVLTAGPPIAAAKSDPPDPLPFHLHAGAIARDGVTLSVALSSDTAYQGGAVMVSANDSVAGNVTVLGRTYALVGDGTGGLAGFVGFGTEDPPGPATLTVTVTRTSGTVEAISRAFTVRKTQWTVDYIDLPPGVGDLLDPAIVQAEQDRLDATYAGVSARQWQGAWGAPLPGPITRAMVTSYFGEQRSFNGGPVGGHHGGTDLGVPAGTPVYAANDGRVVLAEPLQVRGNMVIIDHGGGVFSGYAHMESLAVSAGQTVVKGQLIGHVGTTGLSTGPHLHWEMSVAGVLVDGLRWLDGSQGF
jgi:murein DD-endopeptidase MepM/ murein hydrolase activator NlpD